MLNFSVSSSLKLFLMDDKGISFHFCIHMSNDQIVNTFDISDSVHLSCCGIISE